MYITISMANAKTNKPSWVPAFQAFTSKTFHASYTGSKHTHSLRLLVLRKNMHAGKFLPRTTLWETHSRVYAFPITTILKFSRLVSFIFYLAYPHNLLLLTHPFIPETRSVTLYLERLLDFEHLEQTKESLLFLTPTTRWLTKFLAGLSQAFDRVTYLGWRSRAILVSRANLLNTLPL